MAFRRHDFFSEHGGLGIYQVDDLVLLMRSPSSIEAFFYPVVVGNWNKAANILVLGFFLFAISGAHRLRHKFLLSCTLPFISIAITLSFSRGGMLVALFGAILILLFRLINHRKVSLYHGYFIFCMMLPFLLTLSTESMRSAWIDTSSIETRIAQLSEFAQAELAGPGSLHDVLDWSRFVGYGVGEYGLRVYNYPFASAHNLFVDSFLSGGLFRLLGLLLLLFAPFVAVAWLRRLDYIRAIGVVALLSISALSFREFALNYLGVSALAAFLVGFFIGVARKGCADYGPNNTRGIEREDS